jgi:hypothetical protein
VFQFGGTAPAFPSTSSSGSSSFNFQAPKPASKEVVSSDLTTDSSKPVFGSGVPFAFGAPAPVSAPKTQPSTTSITAPIPKAPISAPVAPTISNSLSIPSASTAVSETVSNKTVISSVGKSSNTGGVEKSSGSSNQVDLARKLRGLNKSFAAEVESLLKDDPFCDITPLFELYTKYRGEINEEYSKGLSNSTNSSTSSQMTKSASNSVPSSSSSSFAVPPTKKDNPSASSLILTSIQQQQSTSSKQSEISQQDPPKVTAPTFNFGAPSTPAGFSFGSSLAKPDTDKPAAPAFGSGFGSSSGTFPTQGSLFGNLSNGTAPSSGTVPLLNGIVTKPYAPGGLAGAPGEGDAEGGAAEDDDDAPKDEQVDTSLLMRGAGEESEETLAEIKTRAFIYANESRSWEKVGVGLMKSNLFIFFLYSFTYTYHLFQICIS